jgi:hypothetical protein
MNQLMLKEHTLSKVEIGLVSRFERGALEGRG